MYKCPDLGGIVDRSPAHKQVVEQVDRIARHLAKDIVSVTIPGPLEVTVVEVSRDVIGLPSYSNTTLSCGDDGIVAG